LKRPEIAVGAITAEDEAFERTLQAMANEEPPEFSEGATLNVLKKEKTSSTHLKEFMEDYAPAENVNQLMEQVHLAKEFGADSIEATPQIIKYYCRKHYPDDVGYFHFHDVSRSGLRAFGKRIAIRIK
jgi:hypothetical protein